MYKHSTVEERKCVCEKCSVLLFITEVCSSSAMSAIVSAIITALVLRLLFVLTCKRKIKNSTSKSVPNTNRPIYEEIEITNTENTFNLSQNAAYQSTLKNI